MSTKPAERVSDERLRECRASLDDTAGVQFYLELSEIRNILNELLALRSPAEGADVDWKSIRELADSETCGDHEAEEVCHICIGIKGARAMLAARQSRPASPLPAELAAEDGWVSVEERLPETAQAVWVWRGNSQHTGSRQVRPAIYEPAFKYPFSGDGPTISHWMPRAVAKMPPPPTEKEGK